MCGIAGIARRSGLPIDVDALLRMRETLSHRGPDDCGLWVDATGAVGLAHRRLAVVDLSINGRQPMSDASGELHISFNGEIYNYKDLRRELQGHGHVFRTATDTEVILEAYRRWGLECLQRLRGMFAFVLCDVSRGRLFAARDRAGEKPFYYAHSAAGIFFASELKALLAHPSLRAQLNLSATEFYLAYGYVPGSMCILDGVLKLPPAHAFTYDLREGGLNLWRYWQLPPPPGADDRANADELVAELSCHLQEAVKSQLEADVPVGVLLSGGVDSSLVTAFAARASALVKTYTVSFPGFGRFDEGPHARLVADHFSTEHTELVAEPSSCDVLETLARQYDEPLADSSIVPTYLIAKLIRQHATVALSGDGGDELFAGYSHHLWLEKQHRYGQWSPHALNRMIGAAAARSPLGMKGRNYLIGLGKSWSPEANVNLYFDRRTRERLLPGLSRGPEDSLIPEKYRASLASGEYSLLRRACEADFRSTMADGYLVKVDRASMLNSLEVRCPFLDHRIVEFAFGRVPDRLKVNGGVLKALPKMLAAKLLPPSFDLNRKQGFSMPLDRWFNDGWGTYMEEVLKDPNCFFSGDVVDELFAWQRRGLPNMARLFSLTMFELWRREYKVVVA